MNHVPRFATSSGTFEGYMAQFRVGCVPFVNARPLVAAFDTPNEFIEVVYEVPSKLPALLDSGAVDAILVSSIELLRRRDLIPFASVGILSEGEVMSVRLLSKVPLAEIQTLALDSSSMTSNMLAQVILAEQGVFPTCEVADPNQTDMLSSFDACVLIGDKGLEADGTGLIDIDLGQAWTDLTGLPFVWALWLGKAKAPIDQSLLGGMLEAAYHTSGFQELHESLQLGRMTGRGPEEEPEHETAQLDSEKAKRDIIIRSAIARSGWTFEQATNYLTNGVMFYHFRMDEALIEFARLLNKYGLAEAEVPLSMRFEDMNLIVENLLRSQLT